MTKRKFYLEIKKKSTVLTSTSVKNYEFKIFNIFSLCNTRCKKAIVQYVLQGSKSQPVRKILEDYFFVLYIKGLLLFLQLVYARSRSMLSIKCLEQFYVKVPCFVVKVNTSINHLLKSGLSRLDHENVFLTWSHSLSYQSYFRRI